MVAGTSYPAGSYVVKGDQAFRPHVLDMFEKQQHPNDFAFPGAPPTAPYDNTGWTLAWQMGVEYDRVMEGFDGPFEMVSDIIEASPAGVVANADGARGYVVDHINDAFVAVNRTLAAGDDAWWYTDEITAGGQAFPAGAPSIWRPTATSFSGSPRRRGSTSWACVSARRVTRCSWSP